MPLHIHLSVKNTCKKYFAVHSDLVYEFTYNLFTIQPNSNISPLYTLPLFDLGGLQIFKLLDTQSIITW